MKDNTWYNDYLQDLMKDVFKDKYGNYRDSVIYEILQT